MGHIEELCMRVHHKSANLRVIPFESSVAMEVRGVYVCFMLFVLAFGKPNARMR